MTKTYYDGHVAELAARLRAAREKHGVNCAAAARLLGMTPQRLNALESARIEAKARDVALIARITGADPLWLLFGDERDPIEVPDDPANYRRPQGQAARTAHREKRHADKARPPRRPELPTWRPANLGRDVRPPLRDTQTSAPPYTPGSTSTEPGDTP